VQNREGLYRVALKGKRLPRATPEYRSWCPKWLGAGSSDGQEKSGDRAKHEEEAGGDPQQSKGSIHLRSDLKC
jgi:hypothetical protein